MKDSIGCSIWQVKVHLKVMTWEKIATLELQTVTKSFASLLPEAFKASPAISQCRNWNQIQQSGEKISVDNRNVTVLA